MKQRIVRIILAGCLLAAASGRAARADIDLPPPPAPNSLQVFFEYDFAPYLVASLLWEPSPGATEYQVYRWEDGVARECIGSISWDIMCTNKVVYYDYGLEYGKHYYYCVVATNTDGNSTCGSPITGGSSGDSNTVDIWMPPPDPANLAATFIGGSNRKVHLTWEADDFANGGFNLYRSDDGGETWSLIGSPDSTKRMFDDTNPLQMRKQYCYVIFSHNQQCWSFNWAITPILNFDVKITCPDYIWENNGTGPKFRFKNQFLVSQVVTPLSGSITPVPPFTYQWEYQGTGTVNNATSPGEATIALGGSPGSGTVKLRALTANGDTGFSDQKNIVIFASHLDRDMANFNKLNEMNPPGVVPEGVASHPKSCGGACSHAYNGQIPSNPGADVPFQPCPENNFVTIARREIFARESYDPQATITNPLDQNDLDLIKKGDVIKFVGHVDHVVTVCNDGMGLTWEFNGANTTIGLIPHWGYSSIGFEINLKNVNTGEWKIKRAIHYENPKVPH